MQFAKQKVIKIMVLTTLLLPMPSRAFIVLDYINVPPSVAKNIQIAKEYGLRGKMYYDQFNLTVGNALAKMSLDMNLGQMEISKKLGLNENLYNLKLKEMMASKKDVCNILVLSDSNSDDACGSKDNVRQAADIQVSRSLSAFMNKSGVNTIGDNKNSDGVVNYNLAKNKMIKKIASKVESEHEYLFKEYSSELKLQKALAENSGKPKPFDGDLMMNPDAYLIYNSEEKDAMRDMISNFISPPYDGGTNTDASYNAEYTVEQMKGHLNTQILHDILTANYGNRVQVGDGLSEMVKMDELSKYYFSGGDDIENTLFHNIGISGDEITPSVMVRESALMQALQIHNSINEFKRMLVKETMLAQKLLLKVESIK